MYYSVFISNENYPNPGRRNMEVLHVVSMHAGTFFDKTWKIQTAYKSKSYKTSMQYKKLEEKKHHFPEI